jgi:hypothetical protein
MNFNSFDSEIKTLSIHVLEQQIGTSDVVKNFDVISLHKKLLPLGLIYYHYQAVLMETILQIFKTQKIRKSCETHKKI